MYGFKTYKDYIDNIQDHQCLLCKNPRIEEYHHIIPKSKNGSNTIENIVGLCKNCHSIIHKDPSYEDLLLSFKQGLKKKYEISLLNITMPFIIESLSRILPLEVIQGQDTKILREKHNLPKDHHIDAYVISISKNPSENIDDSLVYSEPYNIKHFKKKSNNNIKQLGSRIYKLGSKIVAKNRHKSFNQKEDSLEEFLDDNSNIPEERKELYSKLKVIPAKRIYTHHKREDILTFKCGDKVLRNKRSKSKSKKREVYIINTTQSSNKRLVHDSGTESFKYCKLLESESLVFV